MPASVPPSPGAAGHAPTTRRVVVFRLNGGQTVEGVAHLPVAQSLVPFLNNRRGGLLTLSSPQGIEGEEEMGHVMMRMASVLYAFPSDPKLAIDHRTPGPSRRLIRLTFHDGSEIQGTLAFPAGIRVSDHLARVDDFVALRGVVLSDVLGGRVDVAFNIDSVNTIVDLGSGDT